MSTQTGPAGDPPVRLRAPGVTVSTLSSRRCRELLATADVGRVGWSAAHGPQIFPVSYAWYDDLVIFRTSPFGVLSELTRRTLAVFEVDEVDPTGHSGWSVLARGYAEAIAAPSSLARLWTRDGAVPWAGGLRELFIAITVTQLTGRAFEPQPDGPR